MSTTRLAEPPSLARLYASAVATAPLHRGESLPDSVYELAARPIDPRHLAGYDRVCGLRYGSTLPATYLHVLSFPLQVALMSERDFPFPLAGLIHVANAITVHRPVTVDEQVALTVRAADLRPHPAGRQLDLLSEASVGGERVWSGRSTYLRRGDGSQARGPAGTRGPRAVPDEPAGTAALVRVPGDIGRRYAAVSGDCNPIHLSRLGAKLFGFPSAIAHGMWVAARSLATLEGRLPGSYSLEVAFKRPVPLPSTVRIAASLEPGGWSLDVRSARSGRPHLTGAVGALT
jgi:acyl dehydratase